MVQGLFLMLRTNFAIFGKISFLITNFVFSCASPGNTSKDTNISICLHNFVILAYYILDVLNGKEGIVMLLPPQRPQYRNPMSMNRNYPNQRAMPSKNGLQNRNAKPNMLSKVLGSESQITNIAGKGVDGLSKTLSGVQQVLNVVQTAAPIVQEYGPMVKNLPAMYRMMKAFKEIDTESNETEASVSNENEVSENVSIEKTSVQVEHDEKKVEHTKRSGDSKPKLFI
ncbi:hypothetical protein D8M05_14550 [Oceanobacillus bengalensis]|uniref:YqfQ-like protein n=2 Tax=Oceanobacillus bengalensis TaxID=1435466 RepID=A0A494YUS3_9BACI|nr:hypothetical protein D8M05_14550 [Oceanobacillus bengalensis]